MGKIEVWDDNEQRIRELADLCDTTTSNIVDCMIELLDMENYGIRGKWEDEIKHMQGID